MPSLYALVVRPWRALAMGIALRRSSCRRVAHSTRSSPAAVALIMLALAAAPTAQAQLRAAPAPAASDTTRVVMAADRPGADLDTLVVLALERSPAMRAARARVEAAQARIAPAGARPDLMLMAGIQNFPVAEPSFTDFMTMKMVGVSQTIPYPGKLALARTAAERELLAAQADVDAVRLELARDVKAAYYGLAYVDRALEIIERNRVVLVGTIEATEAIYSAGRGGQQDVLRARVEAAGLGESAATLLEQRRAAVAQLNAVLDRPSEAPVGEPAFPGVLVRAAVADTASQVRFVAPTLGARAADSPLPPLDALQQLAVERSPMLRAHEARIAARAAQVELARKAHLPDFDVSVSYGQRSGFTDMVTAMVAVPIPLQRGSKQDALLAAERAELAALEAEHHTMVNELRAEVARRVAELERDRAQLALYKRAVLPQAQAALQASLAAFQTGRTDLTAVLETQTTLFNYETAYFRALADFATGVAELERVVATEILP